MPAKYTCGRKGDTILEPAELRIVKIGTVQIRGTMCVWEWGIKEDVGIKEEVGN
jgi:hypothetical protein